MPFKTTPPNYHVWQSMRDRCLNPRSRAYKDYGGRGISICSEWDSYKQWFVDMGPRPTPKHTLERIDNNGNYEPANCKWATRKEQQRNRRATRYVTIDGQKYKAIELAERSGLKTDTIVDRANQGLSLEQVLDPTKRVFKAGLALGGKANGARQRAKTHCPHGHSYDDAIINKHGHRRCRTCFYKKERERRMRKKLKEQS